MPRAAKPPPAKPPAAPPSVAPPPGRSLREFALAELDRATEQLGREGQARHAGVHQARKSMRRARATLALARRALGEAGKRLAKMGGTMPDLEDTPRRRFGGQ